MLININDLKGMRIGATDGEIGKISDVYFDGDRWVVRYFVVETGSWLHSRKVLLSPRSVDKVNAVGGVASVTLTRDQVRDSPHFDTDKPVSRQHEEEFNAYYGFPPYWGGAYLWGGSPYPDLIPAPGQRHGPTDNTQPPQQRADPDLRSANEVEGYHIHATDAMLGHVDDFIVDDADWAVRYLVVDTRNWWPGKDVLVDTAAVDAVDWYRRLVHLTIDRHTVEASPKYDEDLIPERDYSQPHLTKMPARSFWRSHP